MILVTEPRIVLLNDTDVDGYHFGCSRVMSDIRMQLFKRNLHPVGSVRVSLDWRKQNEALVNGAELLIINGEGTLHHGSRKGRWLLEAASVVKANGGKVALINALWQDNPADWASLIKNADILTCRDSKSAAAMSLATGRNDVRFIGDLSMSQSIAPQEISRNGLLVGDSVHSEITNRLAAFGDTVPNAEIVPVTSSLKFISPRLKGIRRIARTAYSDFMQSLYLKKHPKARFLNTEHDYIALLGQKSLSVTGRFHAVCLAIATHTPFVALQSNSWKIQALVDDIGLSKDRVAGLEQLSPDFLNPARWTYSATELTNVEERLAAWRHATTKLFDEIKELV